MTNIYNGSEEHKINAAKARAKAYTKRECVHCKVSMASGAHAKHQKTCLYSDDNIRNCAQCSVRIYDLNKIRFCSRSCAATYNNIHYPKRSVGLNPRGPLPKNMEKNVEHYNCLICGTDCIVKRNSRGLLCSSSKCDGLYKWNKIKAKIDNSDFEGVGKNSFKRYLKEKYGEQCIFCGQGSIWNNQPLTLDMDHIDGDTANNTLENLRLLCPNCHTQTHTWGKKKRDQ